MSKDYDDYFKPIVVTDFEQEEVDKFRRQVFEESLADPKAPIRVYIDTDGGYVDGLASMVETLQSVPNPIHTIVTGRACSAGAFLLSFGHKRYCGKHSYIMIHKISSGAWGHVDDMNITLEEINRLNNYWLSRLADNCGLDVDEVTERLNRVRDHYLSASDALEFGIIDHIGIPQVQYKLKKARKTNVKKSKTKKKTRRR